MVELRSRLTLLLPISKEWCQLAHMIWADTLTEQGKQGNNRQSIFYWQRTSELIRVHMADLRAITGRREGVGSELRFGGFAQG